MPYGLLDSPTMATYVEFVSGDGLTLRQLKDQEKRKLRLVDPRGRLSTLSPDKVLFRHTGSSPEAVAEQIQALVEEVDVPLLWESVLEEERAGPRSAAALALIYFDDDKDLHGSAVFRALTAEGAHFRRRGSEFEARDREELAQLQQQREAEERAEAEQARLGRCLSAGEVSDALAARLLRHLRGEEDRQLARVLDGTFNAPTRSAFSLLVRLGRLPPTAALEVIQANLRRKHPEPVVAYAAGVELPEVRGQVEPAFFSIDDDDTREVDDVLTVHQEGPQLRVDIDIADPSSFIAMGDPVDREALKRAATLYLPTGAFYMLPERLGCQVGSLSVGEARPALRTSVWLDEQGRVTGYEHRRVTIRVGERLNYEQADQLLAEGEGETAQALRLLDGVARARAELRRSRGALFITRREWKLRVHDQGERVEVLAMDPASPSRALVAEMMILAGSLGAREASERGVPIIYRTQAPPTDPLPEVAEGHPAAFALLRRHLHPAALSLSPDLHWGLGLEAYTQVTSPLRRYADLVAQRQLGAVLAGETPPYDAQELLRVLAAAEATEKEAKRIEAAVKERWSLEFVRRLEQKESLEAMVLSEHPAGGYQAQLQCCGAVGILQDDRRHEPGAELEVDVKTVRPDTGTLRLLPSPT